MKRQIPLKFKNSDGTFTILPDEARQLCGYDCDGNEVYEGDELISDDSVLFIADKIGQAGRYCKDYDEDMALIVFDDTDIDMLRLREGSNFYFDRKKKGEF